MLMEECDSLNAIGPHGLIGNGTIRRCGLVGRNVSLGVGFEVSKVTAKPSVSWLIDQDLSLSSCSISCLCAAMLWVMIIVD